MCYSHYGEMCSQERDVTRWHSRYHYERMRNLLYVALIKELQNTTVDTFIHRRDESMDWTHSLLTIEKKRNGLRLCIDQQELNKSIKKTQTFPFALKEWNVCQDGRSQILQQIRCEGWVLADSPGYRILQDLHFQITIWRILLLEIAFWSLFGSKNIHSTMSQALEGLTGMKVIEWGSPAIEHQVWWWRILKTARRNNFKLNKAKRQSQATEITYALMREIDHKRNSKIQVIYAETQRDFSDWKACWMMSESS